MTLTPTSPQKTLYPCADVIRANARIEAQRREINELKASLKTITEKLEQFAEVATLFKFLLSLSIGGGALSLITLIMTIYRMLNG